MKLKKWENHKPVFESDQYHREMMQYSPWSGHRLFAYDYVANLKPHRIVELGSYYGCSAFTFLQAIKDFQLSSEFFGIDTWEGDTFTASDYEEDIYGAYRNVNESCFSQQKSYMLRMTFDEAADKFEDRSIDLLHIDGSHLYEDVKHDFMTWKRKINKGGVVFFHDISTDGLFGKPLGSHVFWEELKKEYPYTLQFDFSFGLGILCFDSGVYHCLCENANQEYYRTILYHHDLENKDQLRKMCFEVRDLKSYIEDLSSQIDVCQTHLKKYRQDQIAKKEYIQKLESENTDLSQKCEENFELVQSMALESENDHKAWNQLLNDKEGYIAELQDMNQEKDKRHEEIVSEYVNTIHGKERYIRELKDTIAAYQKNLEQKDAYAEELKSAVQKLNEGLSQKDCYIRELTVVQNKYEETVQGKDQYIQELEYTITAYQKNIEEKEAYAGELNFAVQKLNEGLAQKDGYIGELIAVQNKYEETVQGKDRYIQELRDTITAYQKNIEEKDAYAEELESAVQKLNEGLSQKDAYAEELNCAVQKLNKGLEQKERYIGELTAAQEEYEKTVNGKQCYIDELESAIDGFNQMVSGKDAYIEELHDTIDKYKTTVEGKDNYIDELVASRQSCQENLTESKKHIAELMDDLNTLKTEKAAIAAELSSMHSENDSLENVVAALREQQKYMDEKMNRIQSELYGSFFGKRILKKMEM